MAIAALFGASCAVFFSADKDSRAADKSLVDRSRTILQMRRRDESALDTSEFRRKTEDIDGDGEPDQTTYLTSSGHTALITRDFNFDGKIDLWQYYDRRGNLVEEEMNLDKDKFVDMVQIYKGETLRRKLMSVGFEEKFTIEKFYSESGELLRVELDQNRDGRTDTWEYYEDGERTRIGWDEDLDGVADMFDEF